MWEYQHAFIKTESLEVAFANWINRDGWEYVDRVLWRVEPNGLPTWSILFRRQRSTGTNKTIRELEAELPLKRYAYEEHMRALQEAFGNADTPY